MSVISQFCNGSISPTLYDAQSILAAVTNDTPAAVTISEQNLFGRIAGGNVASLTLLQAHKLLTVVKNFYDPTSAVPGSPSTGDRYISLATANGWTIDRVYTYNGSSWLEITPTNGFFVCVFDRYEIYKYVDSKWQLLSIPYYNHGTTTGAGGTYTYNALQYGCYRIQIAHTTTINPTGTYTSGALYRVAWYIVNGGAATITFNANIKWATGTKPTFTTSGTDLVVFTTIDGTTWHGSTAGLDYK